MWVLNHKLIFALLLVFCIINLSCIFAEDNASVVETDDKTPDIPDLVYNDTNYVYPSNVESYFPDNTLDSKYQNKTLVFVGDFNNLGKLAIDCNNVSVKASGAMFKNTVFDIMGNGIILNGLNISLDESFKDNDGASIYVGGSDVVLDNLNINYVAPYDSEAYAILSYRSNNLKILNSLFYFEGHNDEINKYNCAVKLRSSYNSLMENNTIISSLPLNNINYGFEGADLNSAYVYTVGIEYCNNFIFKNNTLISDVNKRPTVSYPTLDTFVISKSDDVLVVNNSIYMTDFVTYPGVNNYLYGMEIHKSNNLTILSNNISIITTGGMLASGTAYPIQINGPAVVNITNNDLYSFSNGPNIGIYSQNFYGKTNIFITNNRINVTGLAGEHDWALVTGIEAQDSNAEILNNQIEVHSVGEVGINDNLFAISYRQFTEGAHTFNIQNNTAFSDGFYAVYLLGSKNSKIINNTLISYKVNTGDDAYKEGVNIHTGDVASNNKAISFWDYFKQYNAISGDGINHSNPNIQVTTNLDGSNFNPQKTYNSDDNPLASLYFNSQNSGSSISDDGVGSQLNIGDGKFDNANSNNQHQNSTFKTKSSTIQSNNSDTSPSLSGNNPTGVGFTGASGDGVSKKIHEIDEKVNNREDIGIFISVILFIISLFLLIVGYRRKNSNLE